MSHLRSALLALASAAALAACGGTFQRDDSTVPEDSSFERVGDDAGSDASAEGEAGASEEETWSDDESVDFDESAGGYEEVE